MARHDIVLGMPWRRKYNRLIDWRNGVLTFEQCDCVIAIDPAQPLKLDTEQKKAVELLKKVTEERPALKMFDGTSLPRSKQTLQTKLEEHV